MSQLTTTTPAAEGELAPAAVGIQAQQLFTQGQLDSVIAERLRRQRRKYKLLEGIDALADSLFERGIVSGADDEERYANLGAALAKLGEAVATQPAPQSPPSPDVISEAAHVFSPELEEELRRELRNSLNATSAEAGRSAAAMADYRLTPRQMELARAAGISYRRYAELLAENLPMNMGR